MPIGSNYLNGLSAVLFYVVFLEWSGDVARGLTEKQIRFVNEYLVDFNATQAALRAGYSKQTSNEQGCRLLANISIQTAIKQKTTEKLSELNISQKQILDEYKKIAFKVEIAEYRGTDKLKALEFLAKISGLCETKQMTEMEVDPLTKSLEEYAKELKND